jgi:hypothetical protein
MYRRTTTARNAGLKVKMASLTAFRIVLISCSSDGSFAAISAGVPLISSIPTSRRDRRLRSALKHVFVDNR